MIDLHDAVFALLKPTADAMNLNLIHSFQNAERVMKPYASIRIDTSVIPQHEMYLPVNEAGYRNFGNNRMATIEVQVYGRNAGVGARRFALGLRSSSNIELATLYNVSICTNLFLSEVPEMINLSQYEERGIYQFRLYYADEMEENVGLIEEVEISHYSETEWDEDALNDTTGNIDGYGDTTWDNKETTWDEEEYCTINIKAFPPHTPIHPEQPDTETE